jgi:hypothetical protein
MHLVDPIIASMLYVPATIVQTSSSQPSLLSTRAITVAGLQKFDYACKHFFAHKEIPPGEQVARIIYSFESEFMQSWIKSDCNRLIGLSFTMFMLEVKCKWLPSDWENKLIQELIAPQGEQEFYEWSISIRKANNELEDADSLQHIPTSRFCAHFVAHLNPALRLAYHTTKNELDAIKDIEVWIHRIIILDVQLMTHQKQITTSMNQAAKMAVKFMNSSNRTPFTNPMPTQTSVTSTAGSGSYMPMVGFITIPKLTQPEKDLLDLHQGCYKCRTFYARHFSRTCTAKHPSLEMCKRVTTVHAMRAKAAYEKSTAPVMAAVFDTGLDENFVDKDFVDLDEFKEYIPPYKLSSLPDHLWWDCCIDAPFTCAPTPICTLINHGAPPVLISEDTIEIYGLVHHKLFKPYAVSAAFVSGQPRAQPVLLTEYCRLNLQSPDAAWKSWMLNAIICPQLQTNIILGLDFLVKNKIVVDAELCTVIAKESGFDLLHPPDLTLCHIPLVVSPAAWHQRDHQLLEASIKQVQKLRWIMHKELHGHLKKQPSKFDLSKHCIGTSNLVGLITTCITQLATESRLSKLDLKMKCKFNDQFPTNIPHMQDLPTNVYHYIEVKPGVAISMAHVYSCPHKYCDGWKTLINQHYAVGRIRPSSSQYTSPSFIIPKADKAVLPRWVNDYHNLNHTTIPNNYPLPCIDNIPADCMKGKIWGKIDMTNSFFQTLVHSNHVKYTATLTPFGLWE